MCNFYVEKTAQFLMKAWNTGEFIRELPIEIRPVSIEEGYKAQDYLLQANGDEHSGWKIGMGSPSAMKCAGLSYPLVGQLTKNRCHENGVNLKLTSAESVTIECEIAFVFERDINPFPGQKPVNEDIRHICVSFEIVRSRYIDCNVVGWPSFIADNVGFEALIISEPCGRGLDLEKLRVINDSTEVYLNGNFKSKALSGDFSTDPVKSLEWLYHHASNRGLTLKAGEIVTTGAMCTPFEIPSCGQSVYARFMDQELKFTL